MLLKKFLPLIALFTNKASASPKTFFPIVVITANCSEFFIANLVTRFVKIDTKFSRPIKLILSRCIFQSVKQKKKPITVGTKKNNR